MRARTQRNDDKLATQVVGNIGLYLVCYRLSRRGWNVMPTARNARGVDIVVYSQDASRTLTIQVKSLSRCPSVPLGGSLDRLFGNFVVVCSNVATENPECSILTPAEVRKLAYCNDAEGGTSYWLERKTYNLKRFREAWDRIGSGLGSSSKTVHQAVATDGRRARR